MLLLAMLIAAFLASFFLTAWIYAISARLLKSPRARLRSGITATVLIAVADVALFVFSPSVKSDQVPPIVVSVFVLATQLAITVLIFKRLFALSIGRAFIMLAVHVSCGIVGLAVALLVVRPHIAEAFVIPTANMAPTISAGDRLLVNKFERSHRWDIVAYRPQGIGGAIYCSRLVGLPGERLKFQDGNLYVGNQMIPAPAVVAGKYQLLPIMKYRDEETIALAADEIFVIGDNVPISYDSRMRGPSKWSSIVGVADVLYWPFNRFRLLR